MEAREQATAAESIATVLQDREQADGYELELSNRERAYLAGARDALQAAAAQHPAPLFQEPGATGRGRRQP